MRRILKLLFLVPILLIAQPEFVWLQSYPLLDVESDPQIFKTNNHEFLISCESWQQESNNEFLMKTSNEGDSTWTRVFATTGGSWSYKNMLEYPSGSYLFTNHYMGHNTIWLIFYANTVITRIDQAGNLAYSVDLDLNGAWNMSGAWHNSPAIPTADGGFIVGKNQATSSNVNHISLSKYDSTGVLEWDRAYFNCDTTSNSSHFLSVLVENQDGQLVLMGRNNGEPFILRTTMDGDSLWSASGSGIPFSPTRLLYIPSSGYLYLQDNLFSFAGSSLAMLDEEFNALWNIGLEAYFSDLDVTSAGDIVVSGSEIRKYSPEGELGWSINLQDIDSTLEWASSAVISENEVTISGLTGLNHDTLLIAALRIDPTSLHEVRNDSKPNHHRLGNHPNPFNPITTISYDLPEQSDVTLNIYDLRGREVRTFQNREQHAGHYEIQWNGVDDSGNPVSTGIYFARLLAGDYSKTIKMVYLE